MRILSRVLVLSLSFVALVTAAEAEQPKQAAAKAPAPVAPPSTMTTLVFRSEMPGLEPNSVDLLPKKLWRAGDRWGRIEHPRDPKTGAAPIVIVASPDAWFADAERRTLEAFKDPGPTYRFRAPIVQPTKELPRSLEDFEFGRELEFMKRRGVTGERKVSERGDAIDLYVAEFEGVRVIVSTEPGTRRVTNALVTRGEQLLAAYEYLEYAPGQPTQASLFQPPPGFRLTEAKKQKPPRKPKSAK